MLPRTTPLTTRLVQVVAVYSPLRRVSAVPPTTRRRTPIRIAQRTAAIAASVIRSTSPACMCALASLSRMLDRREDEPGCPARPRLTDQLCGETPTGLRSGVEAGIRRPDRLLRWPHHGRTN